MLPVVIVDKDILAWRHHTGQDIPRGGGEVAARKASAVGPSASGNDDNVGRGIRHVRARRFLAEADFDAQLLHAVLQPAHDARQCLAPCRARGDIDLPAHAGLPLEHDHGVPRSASTRAASRPAGPPPTTTTRRRAPARA